jgi:hypothetical protein
MAANVGYEQSLTQMCYLTGRRELSIKGQVSVTGQNQTILCLVKIVDFGHPREKSFKKVKHVPKEKK